MTENPFIEKVRAEFRRNMLNPLTGEVEGQPEEIELFLTQSLTEAMEEGRKHGNERYKQGYNEGYAEGKQHGYLDAISDVEREMPDQWPSLTPAFQKGWDAFRAEILTTLSRLRGEK